MPPTPSETASLNRAVGELTGELRSFRETLNREQDRVLVRMNLHEQRIVACEQALIEPDPDKYATTSDLEWLRKQRNRQGAWAPLYGQWPTFLTSVVSICIALHAMGAF